MISIKNVRIGDRRFRLYTSREEERRRGTRVGEDLQGWLYLEIAPGIVYKNWIVTQQVSPYTSSTL